MLTTAAAARKPAPPQGELALGMDDAVVDATVGGVPLRLRVDLDQDDVIELNPGAAARLPLAFGPGFEAEVGRVTLAGVTAVTKLTVAGREIQAQLASHGRDCCEGVDGAISPAILPYARIRFTRGEPMAKLEERLFFMTNDAQSGLHAPVRGVQLRYSLHRRESVATASAAAILSRATPGRFDGPYRQSAGAFGIARPVRLMRFVQPVPLGGFAVSEILVRTADFGGNMVLPGEEVRPGDIVVRKRPPEQHAWPAVLLARDYLEACSEILFTNPDHRLALRCAFTTP